MMVPPLIAAADLAALLGWNERELRRKARQIGACRVFGKTMVFTEEDIAVLMEDARPCRSQSTVAAASGTTAERLPAGDSEALRARLTRGTRSGSRQRSKPQNGAVISMAQPKS